MSPSVGVDQSIDADLSITMIRIISYCFTPTGTALHVQKRSKCDLVAATR